MKKAVAEIRGSKKYSDLRGKVTFCEIGRGVMITAEVKNLPVGERFFGFHIHEGNTCTGNSDDVFFDAKGHYNPDGAEHPYHRGDLPPLLSHDGYACMSVVTDRFKLCEVIGRAVIIHSAPDDFTTQPGGNAGEKIGCGIIKEHIKMKNL